jgi:hypothetical protein
MMLIKSLIYHRFFEMNSAGGATLEYNAGDRNRLIYMILHDPETSLRD